jgi:hypothetical protein
MKKLQNYLLSMTELVYDSILCHVFYFKIEDPNYFDWQTTKSWYCSLFHYISIRWQGFKRHTKKNPYCSIAIIYLRFLFIKLSFRIGLQNITWFHIRNEELFSLKCRYLNWRRWPPF